MVATFVMVARFPATIKVFIDFDRRGASIRFGVGWCGSLGWASRALCVFGSAAPIAFHVHLEDGCMMNEPVDGGQRHGRIGEYRIPFSEGLVCRDQHGSALISRADEFEQDARFSLILGDVGNVVEDQQVEFIQLRDGAFEDEIAPGLLQLLNQVGGSGEEHAVAFLDEGQADGGAKMRLAHAWWAEQQNVAALSDPAIACGNGADVRLGQHGDGCEVEGLKRLSGQQSGLRQVSLDPAAITFSQFMFHQGAEQACGGPPFFIGLFCKAWPEGFDGGQAQLGQGQVQAGSICLGRCHAVTSRVDAALLTNRL